MVYENGAEIHHANPGDVAVVAREPGEEIEGTFVQRSERPALEPLLRATGEFIATALQHRTMLCGVLARVNAGRICDSKFPGTLRANSKAAAADVDARVCESSDAQPRGKGRRVQRNKGALEMFESVKPAVRNFKDQQDAAGPEDAKNLRKSTILQFTGFEVMKHENRNRGRKRFVGKRQ